MRLYRTASACLGLAALLCAAGEARAQGGVNPGSANDLGYYATTGTAISPLATANNGVLVTSGSGVPSISNLLPSSLSVTQTVAGNNATLGIDSSGVAGGYGAFLNPKNSARNWLVGAFGAASGLS